MPQTTFWGKTSFVQELTCPVCAQAVSLVEDRTHLHFFCSEGHRFKLGDLASMAGPDLERAVDALCTRLPRNLSLVMRLSSEAEDEGIDWIPARCQQALRDLH